MLSDANVKLGSGHFLPKEAFALVEATRKAEARRILIAHPETPPSVFGTDDQREFVGMGAMIEHSIPLVSNPNTLREIAVNKAVGADKCILSSDIGAIIKGLQDGNVSRILLRKITVAQWSRCHLFNL
jgi:hypothetical protein